MANENENLLEEILSLTSRGMFIELPISHLQDAIRPKIHELRRHGVVFEAQLQGWLKDNNLKAEYIKERDRWSISTEEKKE